MAVFGCCQLKLILRLNTYKSGLKCAQLQRLVNNKNVLTLCDFSGPSIPYKCLTTSSLLSLLNNKSKTAQLYNLRQLDNNQKYCSLLGNGNYYSMASIPDGTSCSKRTLSTKSSDPNKPEVNDESSSSNVAGAQLSTKDKFKKAVKEYGATVIVFHVIMSLTSLGISYALVSSGLDVVALLEKMGVGQAILESKITQGASTFVVAYAFHKVFAPVRITITLTATPLIVRYLRGIGFLKKPTA